MDGTDALFELLIGLGAQGKWALPPGVVSRTRHTEHAGKTGDPVVRLLFIDQAKSHRG
jgi:hypothetical protein